jgi:hypothetical protein
MRKNSRWRRKEELGLGLESSDYILPTTPVLTHRYIYFLVTPFWVIHPYTRLDCALGPWSLLRLGRVGSWAADRCASLDAHRTVRLKLD